MSFDLTRIIASLFFIFALFPFVSFGTNSMDTQPHFILFGFFSILLFAYSGPIFYKAIHLVTLSIIVFLTLLITANTFDFIFFRAVASYSAFSITLIAAIIYFMKYGIPIKTIVVSNIAYLLVAIIQSFSPLELKNEIFNFLVLSNSLGNASRGVIGLTPEPTIFATLLFFFAWIYLVIYDYKPSQKIKLMIIVNIMAILFLTKSSMVVLFLLVSLGFYLLRNIRKKYILLLSIVSAILVVSFFYVFIQYLPSSRVSHLLNLLIVKDGNIFENLKWIVYFDASINDRVLNVFFPYYGFVLNNGLPGGVHSFYDTSVVLVKYFDGYFWHGLGSNKILSFVGAFIYELGIIGLIYIIYVYWLLRDKSNPNRIFELSLLFILLNSSIPVAFPFVAILMAVMYCQKYNNDTQDLLIE